MSETQGFPAKPHAQESMTSPAPAPRHFCGFSQTVAAQELHCGDEEITVGRSSRKRGADSTEAELKDAPVWEIYLTQFLFLKGVDSKHGDLFYSLSLNNY